MKNKEAGKGSIRGRVLGFDPDLHHCGWAVVDNFEPVEVGVIELHGPKSEWPGGVEAVLQMVERVHEVLSTRYFTVDAAVVESQRVYRDGAEKAGDLILLATVSGAALGALAKQPRAARYLVGPQDWKGTVRKDIMFKRILRAANIQFKQEGKGKVPLLRPYWGDLWPYPPDSLRDQEHAIDALGLALFGAGVLHEDQQSFLELNNPPKDFPSIL